MVMVFNKELREMTCFHSHIHAWEKNEHETDDSMCICVHAVCVIKWRQQAKERERVERMNMKKIAV